MGYLLGASGRLRTQSLNPKMFFSFNQSSQISASARRARCARFSDAMMTTLWKIDCKGALFGSLCNIDKDVVGSRGLSHWQFFHHIFKSTKISFSFKPKFSSSDRYKIFTCHDSCAVVACAKFCCKMMVSNRIPVTQIFHKIWDVYEISLMEWALVADIFVARLWWHGYKDHIKNIFVHHG